MRGTRATVLAALLLATPAYAAPTAESPLPDCQVAAFSPDFGRDRTGFCVGLRGATEVTGLGVLVTRDAGVTWKPAAAAGLDASDSTLIGAVVVSPRFAMDRTLFVQTSHGLFASSDLAASFKPVDALSGPSWTGVDNVAAYTERPLAAGVGSERTVLAYAYGSASHKIDPPLVAPTPGAPGEEYQYVAVPDAFGTRLLGLTAEPDTTNEARRYRDALYRCDAVTVTCAERLAQFPAGWVAERLWAGTPSGTRPAPLYVQLRKVRETHVVEVRRSLDGGRTFEPWSPVNALLARYTAARAPWPRVWMAEQPGRPSRVYLRIAATAQRGKAAPSAEILYTSANGGASWTLVATNGYGSPRGARGRVPWTQSDQRTGPRVYVAPDGRLFAVGENAAYRGVFCSVDGGLTWGYRCRRR